MTTPTQDDILSAPTVRELDRLRLLIGGQIKGGNDSPELRRLYDLAAKRAVDLHRSQR